MVVLRPQGGGITLVVVACIFLPLCVASTSLRIWARQIKRKQLEINDYTVVVATVYLPAFTSAPLNTDSLRSGC